MSFIGKLIMNSLFGKFSTNNYNILYAILTQDQINDLILNNYTIISQNPISQSSFLVTYTPLYNIVGHKIHIPQSPYNTNPLISSFVAAESRIFMHKLLHNQSIYYMDTDSLFIDSPLPPHLVHHKFIGKAKLVDTIKTAVFINLKKYSYINIHDQEKTV